MSYIDDIDDFINSMDFGNVMFSVKRHSGNTHQVIAHSYESHKFNDNSKLVAALVKLIKDAADSKFSGSLSFTIVVKDGQVTRLIKQDNNQIDYYAKSGYDRQKTTGEGLQGRKITGEDNEVQNKQ